MAFNVGYLDPSQTAFQNIGCFVLQDGRRFYDFACLFAANINWDSQNQRAVLSFNPQIAAALKSGAVGALQKLGITVLLSVLGNHQPAGWSCFTDEASATAFAQQLAKAVQTFGLDGIDIDDEYSTCEPNDTSLIMVTHALRELEPDIVISKALWDDYDYFEANWNGMTLAEQLSYGWEMGYGPGTPDERLGPYLQYGFQKNQLGLGVWSGQPSDVTSQTQQVQQEGYGGMMMYAVNDDQGTLSYANDISKVVYGQGVSVASGCWS
jgi:chitinase